MKQVQIRIRRYLFTTLGHAIWLSVTFMIFSLSYASGLRWDIVLIVAILSGLLTFGMWFGVSIEYFRMRKTLEMVDREISRSNQSALTIWWKENGNWRI